MVLPHHIQPELIVDEQALQQQHAVFGVALDGLLLLGRGVFTLHGQFVLQGRHADVHGERRTHQAVPLALRQLELLRHDVAQRATHQRVRCAVSHGGFGRVLEHQVQRRVDVVRHQVLQPCIELPHLARKVLHLQRPAQQHRQG